MTEKERIGAIKTDIKTSDDITKLALLFGMSKGEFCQKLVKDFVENHLNEIEKKYKEFISELR